VKWSVFTSKHLTVKMHREHGVESMGECTSHKFLCFIWGTSLVVFCVCVCVCVCIIFIR